ncbi:MAG TPA: hypothetical protein VGB26_00910 [Nitrospiria bacterium]
MSLGLENIRIKEWYVPQFGPTKFRVFMGLLFLPYTGMVLSFTVIGSMMAEEIHWIRVLAILVIYFLALGIGAHALDAIGRGGIKPWGTILSNGQLWFLAISSIMMAYIIGMYYMVLYSPLLWAIAIPEGFFLLAYNLEWFKGRFHTDFWFSVSWGGLPVLAGYIIQTNQISVGVLLVALSMMFLSLVEIKASRPYKEMKRQSGGDKHLEEKGGLQYLEAILKSISIGVILLGVGLLCWRVFE